MNKAFHTVYLTLTFLVAALSTTAVVASTVVENELVKKQNALGNRFDTICIGGIGLSVVAIIQDSVADAVSVFRAQKENGNIFRYIRRTTRIGALGCMVMAAITLKQLTDVNIEIRISQDER